MTTTEPPNKKYNHTNKKKTEQKKGQTHEFSLPLTPFLLPFTSTVVATLLRSLKDRTEARIHTPPHPSCASPPLSSLLVTMGTKGHGGSHVGGLLVTFLQSLRYRSDFRKKVFLAVFVAALLSCLYVRNEFCFNSRHKMNDLFQRTSAALDESGEDWWIDYGTLLGAIREERLIEHEYDIDLGIMHGSCDKVYAHKAAFEKRGLKLYNRADFIPAKNKLNYDTEKQRFYYSDGYIHAPCLRVYHPSGYFGDIYDYSEYSSAAIKQHLTKEGSIFNAPHNADPSGKDYNRNDPDAPLLMCNSHALLDAEKEKGGCVYTTSLRPLNQRQFLGRSVPVPAKPIDFLVGYYGKSWTTPLTKGVRGPVCYLDFSS